jgi:hypothetical protein
LGKTFLGDPWERNLRVPCGGSMAGPPWGSMGRSRGGPWEVISGGDHRGGSPGATSEGDHCGDHPWGNLWGGSLGGTLGQSLLEEPLRGDPWEGIRGGYLSGGSLEGSLEGGAWDRGQHLSWAYALSDE